MTTIQHEQAMSGTWTGGDDLTTNGGSMVISKEKNLRFNDVAEYARLAVREATLDRRDDGSWFAEIPRFEGVWASEASAKETLDALEEVVFDWAVLKIQHEDRDLPIVE